ncbi:RNA polymerase sigma factor SigJ [Bacillaceae bacterium SAOS 7]|nr:RNA polymerase sigma factor SigJ [Bacillaceae bacterium SAOS 7]
MDDSKELELEKAYLETFPLLRHLAYHILGSLTDAEDAVHDVYINVLNKQELSEIKNFKSFMCKSVTNKCMDVLKSAQRKREVYTGIWLPEPLVTEDDPLNILVKQYTLSYSFMFLLERLTPIERAVFILREVFDYSFADIASFVDKKEPTCRKILSRGKKKLSQLDVNDHHDKQEVDVPIKDDDVTQAFINAFDSGDMNQLLQLFSEEIIYYADGGGVVKVALRPLTYKAVLQLFQFLRGQFQDKQVYKMCKHQINGESGIVLYEHDVPIAVICFSIENGQIVNIYNQMNPEKIK